MALGAVATAGGDTRRPEGALATEVLEEEEDDGALMFNSEDEESIPPALTSGFPENSTETSVDAEREGVPAELITRPGDCANPPPPGD